MRYMSYAKFLNLGNGVLGKRMNKICSLKIWNLEDWGNSEFLVEYLRDQPHDLFSVRFGKLINFSFEKLIKR